MLTRFTDAQHLERMRLLDENNLLCQVPPWKLRDTVAQAYAQCRIRTNEPTPASLKTLCRENEHIGAPHVSCYGRQDWNRLTWVAFAVVFSLLYCWSESILKAWVVAFILVTVEKSWPGPSVGPLSVLLFKVVGMEMSVEKATVLAVVLWLSVLACEGAHVWLSNDRI